MPEPRVEPAAYRLRIEYDGARFKGWQKLGAEQKVRTVTDVLTAALEKGGLKVLALVGSGRTDAGVHAVGQVAHLQVPGPGLPPDRLRRLFEEHLPSDVVVSLVDFASPKFHARHDAVDRTYVYQVSRRPTAIARHFVWPVAGSLDVDRMARAWEAFEGFHDVSAFAATSKHDDPHCEVGRCEIAEDGALVLLRTTASHFLRRQARRMVGAAVRCGLGHEEPGRIAADLATPTPEANRRWGELAAPPDGLFLEYVRYDGEPEVGPLRALTPVGV